MIDPVRAALDAVVRAGERACDVCLVERERLEAEVRHGEVDRLSRAYDRVLSLRLFHQTQAASLSSSDLTEEGIRDLVGRACELARASEPDPCAGLPDEKSEDEPDLELSCPRTAACTAEEAIERALAADRAACGHDERIAPVGSAGVRISRGELRLARSDGFDRSYRSTRASAHCIAIAATDGEKQRDMVSAAECSLDALPTPDALGRESAARAVQRLGARKVPTARIPVIYEPRTAITLAGHLAEALVGTAIDQGRSFLAEKIGDPVAAPEVALVDDGRLRGGIGSRPFDGEGVRTRRTLLIEKGILRAYLLDSYTARRLGSRTTGSAVRALRGAVEPGASNLFFEGGREPPDEIVARTPRGLLVTDVLGFGFDTVTGDYSRGVAGLWIEDGAVVHAVQEVTVAGNLLQMLCDVDAVGNDLTFFHGTGAPTLRFRELTVAGV